jgi:hypothetical protein
MDIAVDVSLDTREAIVRLISMTVSLTIVSMVPDVLIVSMITVVSANLATVARTVMSLAQ